MKVTVTEALRIKNQVSQKVQQVQRDGHALRYGVTMEGDTVVGDQDTAKFQDFLESLCKVYGRGETINSILARFNVESGIADAVRRKANLASVQQYLELAVSQSVARKMTRYEGVGSARVAVMQTFVPDLNKTDLKAKIKHVKDEIRKLQSMIDSKNAQEIELPFSYEDLDSIAVE